MAAASERSSEEVDQRERSNKKVKRTDVLAIDFSQPIAPEERLFPEEPRRKGSYKFMLTGQSPGVAEEDIAADDLEGFFSDESDPEDDVDEDPFSPTIRLSSSDKKRIYLPTH
ncbi:hypothetical protein Tsubulata_024173 [Turnera subulata]|uniref:Uncharacterized protein n=1 Tax=Turnera subulata TaxID=218843 RepID=A0A9Q0GDL2_9ROSI|nr:hypothetical protein Tsubulata_024173 [Turnera subulata]